MKRIIVASVLMWSCFGMAQPAETQTTTTETTVSTDPAPAPAADDGDKKDSGGFFAEPAVTWQKTDSEFNYGSGTAGRSESEIEGWGIGARLGFHANEVFFIGMDGRYSMLDFNEDAVSYDADAKEVNYGPVFGIQMPDYGLRVWGTYVAGGNLDPDADGNFDVKFEDAKGYRVGVGFHLKSFSINGEFQKIKYDTTKIQQLGPITNPGETTSNNLETEAWIASVSFPIEM